METMIGSCGNCLSYRQMETKMAPMIPTSSYSYSVLFFPLGYGFSNSFLRNRIWQKWWDVSSEIRLHKDCNSCLESTLSLSFSPISHSEGKQDAMLWATVWRDSGGKELRSLVNSQWGLRPANGHIRKLGSGPSSSRALRQLLPLSKP